MRVSLFVAELIQMLWLIFTIATTVGCGATVYTVITTEGWRSWVFVYSVTVLLCGVQLGLCWIVKIMEIECTGTPK